MYLSLTASKQHSVGENLKVLICIHIKHRERHISARFRICGVGSQQVARGMVHMAWHGMGWVSLGPDQNLYL